MREQLTRKKVDLQDVNVNFMEYVIVTKPRSSNDALDGVIKYIGNYSLDGDYSYVVRIPREIWLKYGSEFYIEVKKYRKISNRYSFLAGEIDFRTGRIDTAWGLFKMLFGMLTGRVKLLDIYEIWV